VCVYIQEFYNHGGVVYKVYVLDEAWFVKADPSIPVSGLGLGLEVWFRV